MSLRVALINPFSDGKGKMISNGIRVLAGIAKISNLHRRINIYDENFESRAKIKKKVEEFDPDILGVSIFTDNFKDAKIILNSIDAPIKIVGGPYTIESPQKILKFSDYIFLGEAEITFKKFLKEMEASKRSFNKIKKEVKQPDKRIIKSEKVSSLEELTFLGWSFLKEYIPMIEASPLWHLKSPLINILSSRGCNNNCVFCLSSKIHGKEIRFRTIKNIEEEINFVNEIMAKERYPPLKSVIFDDSDIFLRDKQSLSEMFFMLKKYNLNYSAFASIENADKDMIELGKNTGLKSLFFGIETHERNRNLIGRGKKFLDDQAEDLLIHCKKNNIFTCLGYIIGYPWENYDDIVKTIDCMDKLPGDYPGIGILDLHPGTAVWNYKQHNIEIYRKSYGNLAENDILCSPHPTINRIELEKLVKEGYKKAYSNPKRISRLNDLNDPSDRLMMQKVFEKKRLIYL